MELSEIDIRVLRLTARRGARLGVTKENYIVELGKELRGIRYDVLERTLAKLDKKGLVHISWMGMKDFVVHPTSRGVEVLHGIFSATATEAAWLDGLRRIPRCRGCGTEVDEGDDLCFACTRKKLLGSDVPSGRGPKLQTYRCMECGGETANEDLICDACAKGGAVGSTPSRPPDAGEGDVCILCGDETANEDFICDACAGRKG